jgi:hypothetical protein
MNEWSVITDFCCREHMVELPFRLLPIYQAATGSAGSAPPWLEPAPTFPLRSPCSRGRLRVDNSFSDFIYVETPQSRSAMACSSHFLKCFARVVRASVPPSSLTISPTL